MLKVNTKNLFVIYGMDLETQKTGINYSNSFKKKVYLSIASISM